MSRRRRSALAPLAALPATGALVAATPSSVTAHAIGGTFTLPVPLWLYLTGAALAVVASFAVVALARSRPPPETTSRPALPVGVARAGHVVLRLLGLVWWYGAIVVGLVVGDISPLPAVLLWVGIWIALPIVAALAGNPWPSMSPFRTTLDAIRAGARAAGTDGDLGLVYPRVLARWPAVAALFAAIMCELILPGTSVAGTVAALMIAYTLVTLIGGLAYGRSWLRNAELLEVLLGWYGRIGPLRGRVRRGWLGGLRSVRGLGWSDAAFVVLALAGITYDGLSETAFGASLLRVLLPPLQAAFGATALTYILVMTIALVAVYAAFLAGFLLVVGLTRRLLAETRVPPMSRVAGAYAATLLPIAAGYLVAHYLTLVIQAVVWLPSLLVDPLASIAPEVDWIPVAFVWYLSVAAIVGGHVAGVTLAHRLTTRWTASRSGLAGVPMLALMVAYTVLSLWIIAQPIVVEPGTVPAALDSAGPTR